MGGLRGGPKARVARAARSGPSRGTTGGKWLGQNNWNIQVFGTMHKVSIEGAGSAIYRSAVKVATKVENFDWTRNHKNFGG